jgi:hypothetical protein
MEVAMPLKLSHRVRVFVTCRLALAIVVCAGAGCRHRHDPLPLRDEVIEERIIHGMLALSGSGDAHQLTLRTGNGPVHLLSTRADSLALERVDGAEIAARGIEDHGALRLERFTVVSVDGEPVIDGKVRVDGPRFVLETPNGRVHLGNPPTAFKTLVGSRVWVAGKVDTGPNRYGVIVP